MSLKTLALALLNTIEDDAELDFLPVLGNAAASIKADDSELNEVAVAAAILPQLALAVPVLESQVVTLVANYVQEAVQALVASAAKDVTAQAAGVTPVAALVTPVPPTFAQAATASPKVGA